MTVRETEFAALDFESAGALRGSTDVPVQIGIAHMHNGKIAADAFFLSYLAADRPIVWSAREVHGITDADVAGAPSLLSLWPSVREKLSGRWIVAHGAPTEKRFLHAFPMHNFGPWVDTLKLARAVYPHLASHALGDIIRALEIEEETRSFYPDFRWHDALSDSIAALVLLRKIIADSDIGERPADVLLHADDSVYHEFKKQ